jgi:hypothetical protein
MRLIDDQPPHLSIVVARPDGISVSLTGEERFRRDVQQAYLGMTKAELSVDLAISEGHVCKYRFYLEHTSLTSYADVSLHAIIAVTALDCRAST